MNKKHLIHTLGVVTPTLILLALCTTLCGLGQLQIRAEFVEPRDRVYAYTVNTSSVGVFPKYVSLLSRSRVVVVGTIGKTSGIAVLDVSNPYGDPVVEDMYPLTGSPTCVAKDGFPVTRIAVGSDRGEIILLKVDGGRLTRHLYTVLGTDFYVNRLFLARDSGGTMKVIALVSEGGPSASPCLNCYVYIFDEEARGVFRIGPRVGNATALGRDYEGIYVQDVAPLAMYDDNNIFWDASNLLVAYIPQKDIVRFVFNITYLREGKTEPVPKALVEVNITVKGLAPMVYGVNADSRGVAQVPVQVDPTRPATILFIIRNTMGEIVWSYAFSYDPARYRVLPEEIPIPAVLLPTPYIDTRPAEKVYGVPPFLRINLMLIDAAPAPMSVVEKGSATFLIDPPMYGFFFIRGARETRPKVIYGSSAGYVSVVTVAVEPNRVRHIVSVEDYIGTGGVYVNDASTYSDGSYIVIGSSDGRLRVYESRAQGDYRLKHIYPLPSAIRSIVTIPMGYGYTYVAVSLSGVQVLRVEQYPLPIFRKTLSLYASLPRYTDGDALPDLSAIALADTGSVTIVRNTHIAVDRQVAMSFDDVLAKDITIRIKMPGDENTEGVTAVFRYPEGKVEYRLDGATALVLKNIIPDIEYVLDIYTTKPYIYNSSIRFLLRENMTVHIIEKKYTDTPTTSMCCTLDIGLRYREYTTKLKIIDNLEVVKLVAPIDIYIDDVVLKENSYENTYTVKLLYGVHKIVVKPSEGFDDAYHTTELEVQIDRDTEVPVVIQRKMYSVMVRVIDGSTGLRPIAPINMTIFGTSYEILPEKHVFNITLPYGAYRAVFKPCVGYEKVYDLNEIDVSVPKTRVYTVSMSRIIYRVDITLRDAYSPTLVAPVDLYLNGTLIISNTTEMMISYNIPYGNWTLKVSPSKGYEYVYEAREVDLYIDGDSSQVIDVLRVQYTVSIDVIDIYGRVVSPLTVVVRGPISVEQSVEPPGRTTHLLLPYGTYTISVEPLNGSIYIPYMLSVDIRASQNIRIPIQRVKYRLEVLVEDRYVGNVIGRFELYANGTKIGENIDVRRDIELPYGVYSIQLKPMIAWDRVYEPSRHLVIHIVGDTSIKIPMERKTYTLKVVTVEGANPIRNAVATIYSRESLEVVTQLISDVNGVIETKLPYGDYRVVLTHPDYNPAEIPYITLDGDKSELVSMTPTIIALLLRYMPVIGTLIGLGIAIYAIMKVRAILARRLAPEEELF